MKNNTISFYTLGCRLNQSETAVITNSFKNKGYAVVDIWEPSDITVINTCTVTEKGDSDTRKLINKLNREKPNSKIALIGCQAELQKDQLKSLPNVKWIVGTAKKMDLADLIENNISSFETNIITPEIPKDSFVLPATGIDQLHTRVNLKIQDGCNFFCSYCEVPYARGRARSREFNDIVNEATILANAGHKEIVLTGINIGLYSNNNNTIIDVINAIEQIKDIKRIRISSLEPTTIDKKLILKMTAAESKLCKYLHIPLQHANNEILKLMNRKYTYEEFNDFINFINQTVEDICIGTDILVGFPTETDSHFSDAYEKLKESHLNYFHVFSYSKRNNAKSKELTQISTSKQIKERNSLLRTLSDKKRLEFYKSQQNKTHNLLIESLRNDYFTGASDNYIKIKIKNENQDLHNKLVKVRIKSINKTDIIGEIKK